MELHANTQSHRQLTIPSSSVHATQVEIYIYSICFVLKQMKAHQIVLLGRPKIYTVKYKAEIETHIRLITSYGLITLKKTFGGKRLIECNCNHSNLPVCIKRDYSHCFASIGNRYTSCIRNAWWEEQTHTWCGALYLLYIDVIMLLLLALGTHACTSSRCLHQPPWVSAQYEENTRL